ncbi:uncharacterized protein LOC135708114 [Ochlerotatus camptorhynchus]|uniref:uncharacterized protein LOC135708114 n=1 Tax=Ochlerotatus camptorhynchus TaxID=644619 RepID=UPI0031DBB50A
MKVSLTLSGLLLGVLLVIHAEAGIVQISAYGDVSRQGDSSLNNSSDESVGTGRAMSSGGYRHIFDGLLTKPVYYGAMGNSFKLPKYINYPSNIQVVYPQRPSKDAVASDRFTPGEAYGGIVFKILKAKQEKRKGYQYQKPNDASLEGSKTNPSPLSAPPAPPPPPAPITPPQLPPLIAGPTPLPPTTSASPSNPLTILPAESPPDASPAMQYMPNIQSHYPPPPANGETRFNDSPPSNQPIPSAELFPFPPNIHSHYHPQPMDDYFQMNGLTSYLPPPTGPNDSYLPPPSGMSADSMESGPPSSSNTSDDTIGTIPMGPDSPYTAYLPPSDPQSPGLKDMMMGMPPGPPMSGPSMNIPFNFPGYEYNHPHDHFPEYVFDHDHDHDHHYDHDHDHHHDEPPPTTPAPPPPPPPPPPKNYNYHYYYISRFLWYTPLWATIYFSFYLLILILRGIGRHVVNYPNKYIGSNVAVSRSLQDMQFMTNEQAAHKADVMTQFVMKQIDDFKEKYIR